MRKLQVLDLFSAAAGGWSLGLHRAGFTTMAACEWIDWRRALYQENNPNVRIYEDVRTLTADRILRDCGCLPDYIVGSPPCQDISSANTKGKGVEGERSVLYFEAVRIIGECRPRGFALENSANLRTRGADSVLAALEELGYAVWSFVVGAGDIGANHERKRSWLIGFDIAQVAHANCQGQFPSSIHAEVGELRPMGDSPRHPTSDGRSEGRTRGRALATEGLPVETCGDADAESQRYEGRRAWGHGQNGDREASTASGPRNPANPDEAGQEAGLQESSLRQAQEPDDGCRYGRGDDGQSIGQVGGSAGACDLAPEPWSDWNGGLADHLRMDDGLSPWVAGTRVAVGGPKGTSAASLIVEAFGDAVVPQIPEAIGRAILRVEAALRVIYAREIAA